MTPTLVLTATAGTVTITAHLYGEVSPERMAAEQQIAQYRAGQLSR